MGAHSGTPNLETFDGPPDGAESGAAMVGRVKGHGSPVEADADLPPLSADHLMGIIKSRRLRSRYLPDDIFAEPAWDMMLHLLHAELRHRATSTSQLAHVANVPITTALRWITALVDRGLFIRYPDPSNESRSFLRLAPRAKWALAHYFSAQEGIRP